MLFMSHNLVLISLYLNVLLVHKLKDKLSVESVQEMLDCWSKMVKSNSAQQAAHLTHIVSTPTVVKLVSMDSLSTQANLV